MPAEHSGSKPAWIETSALAAPTLLGAAAGFLIGDLMHRNARRGFGIGIGALGVAALLPFVVDGLNNLVTGPKSRVGVRRRIQASATQASERQTTMKSTPSYVSKVCCKTSPLRFTHQKSP